MPVESSVVWGKNALFHSVEVHKRLRNAVLQISTDIPWRLQAKDSSNHPSGQQSIATTHDSAPPASMSANPTDERSNAAVALYAAMVKDSVANQVVAVCPIVDVLSMLYAGSAGDTTAAMKRGLGLSGAPGSHPLAAPSVQSEDPASSTFGSGARISLQRGVGLHASYHEQLQRADMGAESVSEVDFQGSPEDCRREINAWISQVTQEHVPELFPKGSMNSSTCFAIAAACYFKAPWKWAMKRDGQMEFHALSMNLSSKPNTRSVDRLLMQHMFSRFDCVSNDRYDAVRLPYKSINAAMVLIKPHGDVFALERELTGSSVVNIMADSRASLLHLEMPPFKVSTGHNVIEALCALQLGCLTDPSTCDLSNMTDEPGLSVSFAKHQAWVAVDEEGTVAGGAFGVLVLRGSAPVVFKFTLDRPFLFIIHDTNTNEPLIMGRVVDPLQATGP
jgi:serpin B